MDVTLRAASSSRVDSPPTGSSCFRRLPGALKAPRRVRHNSRHLSRARIVVGRERSVWRSHAAESPEMTGGLGCIGRACVIVHLSYPATCEPIPARPQRRPDPGPWFRSRCPTLSRTPGGHGDCGRLSSREDTGDVPSRDEVCARTLVGLGPCR